MIINGNAFENRSPVCEGQNDVHIFLSADMLARRSHVAARGQRTPTPPGSVTLRFAPVGAGQRSPWPFAPSPSADVPAGSAYAERYFHHPALMECVQSIYQKHPRQTKTPQ